MGQIDKYAFYALCEKYGYKLKSKIGLIESILNSPLYGDTLYFQEEENILAIAEFLDFLRSVGNEIEMKGTIKNKRHDGEIINTDRKHSLNNAFLKDRIQHFLSDLIQEESIGYIIWEDIPDEPEDKPEDNPEIEKIQEPKSPLQGIIDVHRQIAASRNIPKNAIKGYKVWQVYLSLWCRKNGEGFIIPNSLNQKELCFIYDCALLAGWDIENKGKGYKSTIGRDKATSVRHWIDAMKNDIKKS